MSILLESNTLHDLNIILALPKENAPIKKLYSIFPSQPPMIKQVLTPTTPQKGKKRRAPLA